MTRPYRQTLIVGIVLLVCGAIAPLLGLLGTVIGMVRSFNTIAQSPTTPHPSELAEGISFSLLTTGLGFAISAVFFIAGAVVTLYAVLKSRKEPE